MADWKDFSAVAKYPRVLEQFGRIDRFKDLVVAEVRGAAAWARRKPSFVGAYGSEARLEVDIEAVPGIPAMRNGGVLG